MKVVTNATETVAGLFTQTEVNHARELLDALVNGDGKFAMPTDPYIISIYRKLLARFEEMQSG